MQTNIYLQKLVHNNHITNSRTSFKAIFKIFSKDIFLIVFQKIYNVNIVLVILF